VTIWKRLLNATSPVTYSVDPSASSFQTSTIAIHRAIPMKMSPRKYSGRAGRPGTSPLKKTTASPNIRVGPMSQFWTRLRPSTRQLRKTVGSCE